MAARPSPTQSSSAPRSSRNGTLRPSTVKATISDRLPIAPEKRSISRLYGALASPITIPARNTARNPDPWASAVAA